MAVSKHLRSLHRCRSRKAHMCSFSVDPESLSAESIQRIEEAYEDIEKGKVYTLEDIKAELDL